MIISEPETSALSAYTRVEPTHYNLHGYRAEVSVSDAAMRAVVGRILADLACLEDARSSEAASYALIGDTERGWSVYANGSPSYQTDNAADALIALEWHLVMDMLAYRRDLFHVHGASLIAPDQSCSLLIVGVSGSGKTTLTLGLMARGFLPHADDVTLIEPTTLELQTFRRAFHMDDRTRALVEALPARPTWDFDAAPPGYFRPPQWAEHSAPVRFILFPMVQSGATPRITPLSVADAAAALLPFSTTLASTPALALAVAGRLTAQAACCSLVTGDLDMTLDRVVALIGADNSRAVRTQDALQ